MGFVRNVKDNFVPAFILIVIVFVLLFIALRAVKGVVGLDGPAAEEEAWSYAKGLGLVVKSVQCMRNDTDGDGYVSCTVTADEGEGKPARIEALECAGALTFNAGCRIQRMGTVNTRIP